MYKNGRLTLKYNQPFHVLSEFLFHSETLQQSFQLAYQCNYFLVFFIGLCFAKKGKKMSKY